jgi:DnaJ-class molecular chaperone
MMIRCPRCHGTEEIRCRICGGIGYLEDRQAGVINLDDADEDDEGVRQPPHISLNMEEEVDD